METKILTPLKIFSSPVRYEIPPFQRPYIWEQEHQWEPLWEDVSNIAQAIIEGGEPPRPHFMGAAVFQPRLHRRGNIDYPGVVDGQQRLITLQLLIDAVQEVFEHQNYKQPAGRLSTLVENQEDFWDGNRENGFKVWPTVRDRDAFQHAMQNDLHSDKYEHSRIVRAHNYFKFQTETWLDEYQLDEERGIQAAEAMDQVLRNELELVVIDLGPHDDPHVIFETLNARGTPLLPSDMIKNGILHKAGIATDGDEASKKARQLWPFDGDWWMDEIGRGHQRRPRIDVYVNNWLTLRNRTETKAHDEFRVFTQYADKLEQQKTTIQEIASDLRRLGEIYRKIEAIEDIQRSDISAFLNTRRVLNVGVITPVLLWLLSSDVPQPQLGKSLKALESFLVRRMACGLSARAYGRLFVPLISEMNSSGPLSVDETIVEYLERQSAPANTWPNDQTLLNQFISAPLYWKLTQGRLRLILEGIEDELRTSKAETQSVPRGLHIEHILPQGWQQHWPLPPQDHTADEDAAIATRNEVIHSIGNLTLVNEKLNPSMSNHPWEKKQKVLFNNSVLFLNKSILENPPPVWDESAIVERAKNLHKVAVRVWPHADAFR